MICWIESVYPVDDLRMTKQIYLFIVMSQYTNSLGEIPAGAINGKPVFYKTYYNFGICTFNDLLFNLNNIDSFELIKEKKRPTFLHGLVLDTLYHPT